jgi:predicted transposase YbfD/YdcC
MPRQDLLTFFDELPDHRVARTRKHNLVDIVLLVLIATILGVQGWDDIHVFGVSRLEQLRTVLVLHNGVPSADTLRRVIGGLDSAAFREAFVRWTQQLCESTAGKLVAVDGKTVRGAARVGEPNLHVVNAWLANNKLVLGQLATDAKSNEITAIPELLALLDVRGAVVSIDAMGCQKSIAKCVREQGADWLFGLKGNQPKLHQEVIEAFDVETCERLQHEAANYAEQVDKGHGRLEIRRVWVLRDVGWLAQSEQWTDLRCAVLVESERTSAKGTSKERRAYISSLEAGAEQMAGLVRGHWQIENNLHWVLDVTFREDHSRISRRHGAENLSLIRKTAMNLLHNAPAPHKHAVSLPKKRLWANSQFGYVVQILRSGLCRG